MTMRSPFSCSPPSQPPADTDDEIQVNGMIRFCEDLGVDPSDIVMLVLAWKLNAATSCVFTRKEFTEGMTALGLDSTAALKAALGDLRGELSNPETFRHVYLYTFDFARNPEQKGLGVSLLATGRVTG
eukprot:m.67104 g.67104  ORF g.67104 m.67104 type:complete len:128 (-) comp7654_c0_seq1:368-751(-)